MNGYMGNILRVNLTTRTVSTIETKQYEAWGGGHGIGSAIFWDLCKDKAISGYDPGNVVTVMTSPLSGTLAPAVAGRCEVQGIGVQSYPVEWFTRSNFGGRFSSMLKYAGWDGVVIEGKADKPVWVNIVNDQVTIEDAAGLWGLDTWTAQEKIWKQVTGEVDRRDWTSLDYARDAGQTTQKPAVLTIGPAGESLCRSACLIHDAGNGAGQGGFGAVWGSKNLKAISVLGTGSVGVADPNALMNARVWAKENYSIDPDDPDMTVGNFPFGGKPGYASSYPQGMRSRPQGCVACHRNCRGRTETGQGNESSCIDFVFYSAFDNGRHGKPTEHVLRAADTIQKMGFNAYDLEAGIMWLSYLHQEGILGRSKAIHTDLAFETLGKAVFVEELIRKIIQKEDIGADLADGLARAAKKWGRLDQDLKSGKLPLQYWGYAQHYDARTEVEWGYGSILGERDINEHDFNWCCYWTPTIAGMAGAPQPISAPDLARLMGEKLKPYCDPMMVDYSDQGIYAESMAKLVAWHRHYTRFWKQSIGYCDWGWADFVNPNAPNRSGITPEGEPLFLNAVTGKNMTFEEGMAIGEKIWNLDRAIWILQGRTRELEVYPDYVYDTPGVPGFSTYEAPYTVPLFEDGEWKYKSVAGRSLDREKVEEFKTRFYTFEVGIPKLAGQPKGS